MKKIQIVRYGELVPCRTAFIDAHTPGSDQKENFTIIGGGVSESMDQHVHIRETPGFNIGAAGQPPKCKNSLHSHRTAEVFFVLSGKWRFFWGLHGTAGEMVMQEGDIFNIPTGIFRGFENVGTDYGMIMAILGGNDSGGGVIWSPHVIQTAMDYGLLLGENGKLYDTKKGESLPDGVSPMPLLTEEELKDFPEVPPEPVIKNFVARYWDMMAIASQKTCEVIGENGLLKDRPGFEVTFVNHLTPIDMTKKNRHQVLMTMRGHWNITTENGSEILSSGDNCLVSPGTSYDLKPSMNGEASMFIVTQTDDEPGPTKTIFTKTIPTKTI